MDRGASYSDDIPEDQALVNAGESLRHDGNESVLLIDDEEDLIEEVSDYLRTLGYRIFPAASGKAGLARLEEAAPDVVICDVSMPGMNGHQVLQSIRGRSDRFANVPFLFLTAYGAHDDQLAGLGIGADDFIAKPAQLSIIAARIRARLDQAARFRRDAELAVQDVGERIAANAAKRQNNLVDAVQQVTRSIEDIGAGLATIAAMMHIDGDAAELARVTLRGVERALAHAKTASIIARVPPAPSRLDPKLCNTASVMMNAVRGTAPGVLTGDISFHVEDGPELIADATQIRSIAANVATWIASFYPGVTLRAEAKPAERGVTLAFAVDSRTPEAIVLAWNLLVRRSAADANDQSLKPADIAMAEAIQALIWTGGSTSADIRKNEAVLNMSCIY